jgi:hypothetical protein
MSKSIFASKTFWANTISMVLELSGLLVSVVPVGSLTVATNALNIALRMVTSKSVTLLPSRPPDAA